MLLAIAIFFWRQIRSGFAWTFGDHYDGFIELAIMGHWRNVLRGTEAWNATGYFYPYAGTLGYNDSYLAYGVLFTLFRALSFDPFVAGELAHMGIKAIGVIGMYLLLRRIVGGGVGWSLLGGLVFAIANNSLVQALHGQLLSVAFAPFAAFLLCSCLRAIREGSKSDVLRWGVAFVLFYAFWLLTAYYMAWYFGFFTVVTGIVAAVDTRRAGLRDAWSFARRNLGALSAIAVAGFVALLPFLVVYLPKARETGGHAWSNAHYYALHLLDPINLGPDNLIWGGLLGWLHRTLLMQDAAGGEFATGITPVLLGLFITQVVVTSRQRNAVGMRPWFWISVAVVLTWLMAFNYGKRGAFSPWELVFRLFPGAKGTRVVARYQLFLMLPVTVFAFRWLSSQKERVRKWAIAAGAFCAVEQLNLAAPAFIDVHQERAMLALVPPIPEDCRSFYVMSARAAGYGRQPDDLIYAHNVDAMFLSAELGVPTINGFSTFNPPDWNFKDAASPDYRDRADAYIRKHALTNVCYLDLVNAGEWQRH